MGVFSLPVIQITLVNSLTGVYHSPYLPGVQRLSLFMKLVLNKKSRPAPRFSSKRRYVRSARLDQRADALSAQHFANFAPVFIYANRLQVWAKSPATGFLRPGTVVTKSRLFPAMRTCSHNNTSFAIYPYLKPGLSIPGNQPSKFTTKHNQQQAKINGSSGFAVKNSRFGGVRAASPPAHPQIWVPATAIPREPNQSFS
jgi:hypothetical protein